jgi:lysozyme
MSRLRTGPRARAVIKKWEGIMDGDPRTVNLDPYLCPADYWTIGWGHVVQDRNGRMLRGRANRAAAYAMFPGGIDMAEAEILLQSDLITYERGVLAVCRPDTNPCQFGAMVSLCFNIGIGAFQRSTLVRLHRAGDDAGAARAFASWNKATVGGVRQELRGLTSRRREEAALYAENPCR